MKNVSIKNHDWELTLSPKVGMNPISLRYRGTPILREPSDENALLDEPVLYGHAHPLAGKPYQECAIHL